MKRFGGGYYRAEATSSANKKQAYTGGSSLRWFHFPGAPKPFPSLDEARQAAREVSAPEAASPTWSDVRALLKAERRWFAEQLEAERERMRAMEKTLEIERDRMLDMEKKWEAERARADQAQANLIAVLTAELERARQREEEWIRRESMRALAQSFRPFPKEQSRAASLEPIDDTPPKKPRKPMKPRAPKAVSFDVQHAPKAARPRKYTRRRAGAVMDDGLTLEDARTERSLIEQQRRDEWQRDARLRLELLRTEEKQRKARIEEERHEGRYAVMQAALKQRDNESAEAEAKPQRASAHAHSNTAKGEERAQTSPEELAQFIEALQGLHARKLAEMKASVQGEVSSESVLMAQEEQREMRSEETTHRPEDRSLAVQQAPPLHDPEGMITIRTLHGWLTIPSEWLRQDIADDVRATLSSLISSHASRRFE